jgi:hypothetical protein
MTPPREPPPQLPLQIAFLTGQSDPRGSALSPAQAAFLDALPAPAAWKVRVNFPYPAATPAHRPVPLVRASWNNTRQLLGSYRQAFAARHRPPVVALLARARWTVLLAGSCGLELLANLDLPAAELERLHVFAYGAVAWRRPACDLRQVRGRRDWIARAGSRVALTAADSWVESGHLDYLGNPRVPELCGAFLREVTARLLGAAAEAQIAEAPTADSAAVDAAGDAAAAGGGAPR